MGSMSGATEDVMSEAIERSCVVVMCISKEYKESANCRLEGKYAQQLYKKGKCRLAFVMMNEEYTTVSQGQGVDGRSPSQLELAVLVLFVRSHPFSISHDLLCVSFVAFCRLARRHRE